MSSNEEAYLRDMIHNATIVHACTMAKCRGCSSCVDKPELVMMLRLLKDAAFDFLESRAK